jgi:hypothetical protein
MLHYLAFTIVVIFSRTPVSHIWNPVVPGKGLDAQVMIYAGAAMNIFEDLVIMVVPIGS